MPRTSTHLRRLAVAACVALVATGVTPPAQAAPVGRASAPLVHSEGDTYVIVPAATELQLLKGPGVSRAHSVAKAGTTQWVGRKAKGRPVVSRLFYSFDLSGLPADAMTEVTLEHDQVSSPNRTCYLDSYGPQVEVVLTGAPAASPRWPGPAAMSGSVASGYAVGSRKACVPYESQTWDVTELVRSAALESATVHLRLASANEKKRSGYRRYATETNGSPSLRVFLRPHPDQPTNLTVDGLAPKSPASPLVTNLATTGLRADLTTPEDCPGTPALTCLGARYELVDPDGTVVSSGEQHLLSQTGNVAQLNGAVGPLREGVDYVARVWGVNLQTGLESIEPGTVTIRYDAPPGAPIVTLPDQWHLGHPLDVTVTAHDTDAAQVCWSLESEDAVHGCADISPSDPTSVTLMASPSLGAVNGTLWVVDDYGSEGTPAIIQGSVVW
jgi:hypothetical protein